MTPEFDSFMVTYMQAKGRDPCKGLKKGLRSAQDKVLDTWGSMTQVLMLANEVMQQETALDSAIIHDWILRGICLSGNANSAISAEHRQASLLRMDPKFLDMAERELSAQAKGKLFRAPFITELRKHAGSFFSLTKSEASMKRVFQCQRVFPRVERQRGCSSGRASNSGSRTPDFCQDSQYSQARTPFPSTRGTFRGRGASSQSRGRSSFGEFSLFFPHRSPSRGQKRHFFPYASSPQTVGTSTPFRVLPWNSLPLQRRRLFPTRPHRTGHPGHS